MLKTIQGHQMRLTVNLTVKNAARKTKSHMRQRLELAVEDRVGMIGLVGPSTRPEKDSGLAF